MLVTCKNCGVSFDGRFSKCMACGAANEPDNEERKQLLQLDVIEHIKQGWTADQAHRWLMEEHRLQHEDADSVVYGALMVLRSKAQRHGQAVVLSGLGLLGLSLILIFIGRIWLVPFVMGVLMIVFGAFKAFTGATITGHHEE